MSKYPLTPADSVAIILIILGFIFLYVGISYEHDGYIVLALIEFLLAIIQGYVNRTDIQFKTRF